ncbi:MAG: 50S ribosomal protein L11 methyltransferase [Clostridium sp.]
MVPAWHETTQLCIRQLRQVCERRFWRSSTWEPEDGILGIAALKLGAKSVFGTEPGRERYRCWLWARTWNPTTFRADRFHVVQGNIIDDRG